MLRRWRGFAAVVLAAASLGSLQPAVAQDPELVEIARLVADQIHDHWTLPAGPEAAGLQIDIALVLAPDGRVQASEIVNVSGVVDEDIARAQAQAALDAVHHFRAVPFEGLPMDRPELWQNLILRFHPDQLAQP